MRGSGDLESSVTALRHDTAQRGFTMFELVVVVLVVSIILAYAFNRFREYPEAAERASFLAVTAQLKSGLNLRMMKGIASADWSELEGLEGSNPVDLMLEAPRNYRGEVAATEADDLPRRSWYFEPEAGELVYLAGDSANLYEYRDGEPVATDRIRMRIRMLYEGDTADPQSLFQRSAGTTDSRGPGDWMGLQLQAMRGYVWDDVTLGIGGAGQ